MRIPEQWFNELEDLTEVDNNQKISYNDNIVTSNGVTAMNTYVIQCRKSDDTTYLITINANKLEQALRLLSQDNQHTTTGVVLTEQWLVDGELCVRGTYKGYAFGAHHGDTDVDYGWHELSYLPRYADESWDMPGDIYDELDELVFDLDAYAMKEAV
jgi:hypothetical protein